MGECNTILNAYTKYRHLEWYCTCLMIYRVLVRIKHTFFQLCIISNWGLRVIHYNKQNHVFSPLKTGRIDTKKVTCAELVGVFSYKTAKVLSLQPYLSSSSHFNFYLFKEKKIFLNFDMKSVFVN